MRSFFVETIWTVERALFRFTCRTCLLHGDWREQLTKAEDDGETHRKVDHQESTVRA